MTLTEITTALRTHPDADRPTTDAAQAGGLQCLICYPAGGITAVYHWGARGFANQALLEAWLQRGELKAES